MKPNKLMQLLKENVRASGPATIRSEASGSDAHVYIDDVIDSYWGASAKALISALAGLQDQTVHLHINSPGGDVFEARAMAAAVVSHPGIVIAHIDGICASAATYLALACSQVRMTEGGLFMVHNSWTMAYGNKTELRDTADLLDKIDGTIISDYCRKTGATKDQVVAWMDATTWFTAEEALAAKFIDVIDPNTKAGSEPAARAKATWNLSAYPNAPQAYSAPAKTIKAESAADTDYLNSMIACSTQCVTLSRDLILANPTTPLREFAEDCIEECGGDIELMKTWVAAPPQPDATDSADLTAKAAAQIQLNRNRLRLIAPI